jgi:hypothetical protein
MKLNKIEYKELNGKQKLRWPRFVGQFSSEVKVYSDC